MSPKAQHQRSSSFNRPAPRGFKLLVTLPVVFATGALGASLAAPKASGFALLQPTTAWTEQLQGNTTSGSEAGQAVRESAVASCMKGRGFDYASGRAEGGSLAPSALRLGDVDAARQFGYGVTLAILDQQRRGQEGNGALDQERPSQANAESQEAFLVALIGPDVPAGEARAEDGWESVELPEGATMLWYRDSCAARAEREVNGADYGRGPGELAREDSAAITQWRACMLEHGHISPRPGAARDALRVGYEQGRFSVEELWELELAIATADATCHSASQREGRVAQR
jgi:hypothetical protein